MYLKYFDRIDSWIATKKNKMITKKIQPSTIVAAPKW